MRIGIATVSNLPTADFSREVALDRQHQVTRKPQNAVAIMKRGECFRKITFDTLRVAIGEGYVNSQQLWRTGDDSEQMVGDSKTVAFMRQEVSGFPRLC